MSTACTSLHKIANQSKHNKYTYDNKIKIYDDFDNIMMDSDKMSSRTILDTFINKYSNSRKF